MDRQLHIIECYIRDTISGVEDPPFRGDLVPEFHLMGLARRAVDCHLAIELGLKALIERSGADFKCEHGLLSQLKQLERAEIAAGVDRRSVSFLRHCFNEAVNFYGANPNTDQPLRSIEDYLAATGGNNAYQRYRYWILKQSLDTKELNQFRLELHIELLHAMRVLLSDLQQTVYDRVERRVREAVTESILKVCSRKGVPDEYKDPIDYINGHDSCLQAFAEAKALNFDVGDEFAQLVLIEADGMLKNSVDTAVRHFASNAWVLPAPPKSVPTPKFEEHREGRAVSVSTPAGTSLGYMERLANGRWAVNALRGYPLVSILAAKRIDGLRHLVETLTTEAFFEVQGEQSLQARILGSPNELLHEQFRGNDHYALELWDEEPSLSAGKSVTMRFRLNADLDWVLKGTVREVEQHRVLIEGDALLAPAGRD